MKNIQRRAFANVEVNIGRTKENGRSIHQACKTFR